MNKTSFRERFYSAILILVTHRAGIEERLAAAGLELAKISETEYDLMPKGLGRDFKEFMGRLTGHGAIPGAVEALTGEEAEVLARDFWSLWERLRSVPEEILVSHASGID